MAGQTVVKLKSFQCCMDHKTKFIFENEYFVYYGPPGVNDLHRHAAYQIAVSENDVIQISDNDDNVVSGHILTVKPLTPHKIHCDGPILLIYLSPRSEYCATLHKHFTQSNIVAIDEQDLPFPIGCSINAVTKALDDIVATPKPGLDPRLLAALADLEKNLGKSSILTTAKRCNLSRSRLRALAREQLGIPLSTWLMWRKIVASNKALAAGQCFSEAALAGGFADQAHFSRTMKRMFGVTPSKALRIYT